MEPIDSVDISKIDGKIICGKRAGSAFVDTIRPSLVDSQCPSGTTPCSETTSIQNTICYPEDQHLENCPITDIFIADQNTGNLLKESSKTSVVLDYKVDDPTKRYLVYSK